MKRTALTLTLTLVLLVSMIAGIQTLNTARANFIPTVSINIDSPINGTTYESAPLLALTVNFYAWGNIGKHVVYNVDDSANNTLPGEFHNIEEILWFAGSTALPKLSNGKHCIKVYAWVDGEENSGFTDRSSSEVVFYVNNQETNEPTIVPPAILICSPQNNSVISSNSVSLVFNVSAPRAVDAVKSELTRVYCKGDWQTERQDLYVQNSSSDESYDFLEFNATLSNIPEGTHELQIMAFGIVNINIAMFGYTFHSDTNVSIVFTVNSIQPTSSPEPQIEPFLTALVSVASIAMAGVALLVYFKKRKG